MHEINIKTSKTSNAVVICPVISTYSWIHSYVHTFFHYWICEANIITLVFNGSLTTFSFSQCMTDALRLGTRSVQWIFYYELSCITFFRTVLWYIFAAILDLKLFRQRASTADKLLKVLKLSLLLLPRNKINKVKRLKIICKLRSLNIYGVRRCFLSCAAFLSV